MMNKWVTGWEDEWGEMGGWVGGREDGQADGWKDGGQRDAVSGSVDGAENREMDEKMSVEANGGKGEWANGTWGKIGKWMVEQVNGKQG